MQLGRKLKRSLSEQTELFLLALVFFSRIPVAKELPYSSGRMQKANRYFPLIGLLLGSLCGLLFIILKQVLSTEISVLLTMGFSLLLTGCFHEDGLADMADGIGGGYTTEKKLAIMKDSRIGTYGASTLIMALLGKFLLLSQLSEGLLNGSLLPLLCWQPASPLSAIFIVWLLAYTLSRGVAGTLIFALPYVSELKSSKSGFLTNKSSAKELLFIAITAILPCLLTAPAIAATLILSAWLFRALFKAWLKARLGGITGDCLGAAQQLMELFIYILLLAVLNPASAVAIG
jgi:adenosylcobinamide-GDP ribazoletransferase